MIIGYRENFDDENSCLVWLNMSFLDADLQKCYIRINSICDDRDLILDEFLVNLNKSIPERKKNDLISRVAKESWENEATIIELLVFLALNPNFWIGDQIKKNQDEVNTIISVSSELALKYQLHTKQRNSLVRMCNELNITTTHLEELFVQCSYNKDKVKKFLTTVWRTYSNDASLIKKYFCGIKNPRSSSKYFTDFYDLITSYRTSHWNNYLEKNKEVLIIDKAFRETRWNRKADIWTFSHKKTVLKNLPPKKCVPQKSKKIIRSNFWTNYIKNTLLNIWVKDISDFMRLKYPDSVHLFWFNSPKESLDFLIKLLSKSLDFQIMYWKAIPNTKIIFTILPEYIFDVTYADISLIQTDILKWIVEYILNETNIDIITDNTKDHEVFLFCEKNESFLRFVLNIIKEDLFVDHISNLGMPPKFWFHDFEFVLNFIRRKCR